jgi:hypothetical protein
LYLQTLRRKRVSGFVLANPEKKKVSEFLLADPELEPYFEPLQSS